MKTDLEKYNARQRRRQISRNFAVWTFEIAILILLWQTR